MKRIITCLSMLAVLLFAGIASSQTIPWTKGLSSSTAACTQVSPGERCYENIAASATDPSTFVDVSKCRWVSILFDPDVDTTDEASCSWEILPKTCQTADANSCQGIYASPPGPIGGENSGMLTGVASSFRATLQAFTSTMVQIVITDTGTCDARVELSCN